jgi:hypothetical protein
MTARAVVRSYGLKEWKGQKSTDSLTALFGENWAPQKKSVYEWTDMFKTGRTSVDAERSGRPHTSLWHAVLSKPGNQSSVGFLPLWLLQATKNALAHPWCKPLVEQPPLRNAHSAQTDSNWTTLAECLVLQYDQAWALFPSTQRKHSNTADKFSISLVHFHVL